MPLPPDLNKPVFELFPEQADRILRNECVLCPNEIYDKDFKDELSRKEYSISGMCQECQDSMWEE